MSAGELSPKEWLYTTGLADLKWAQGLPIFDKLSRWRMKNGKVPQNVSQYVEMKQELAQKELSISEQDFCEKWNVQQRNYDIKNRFHKSQLFKEKIYESSYNKIDAEYFKIWLLDNYNIEEHHIISFEKYLDDLTIDSDKMEHEVIKLFGSPKSQEDLTKKFKNTHLKFNPNPDFKAYDKKVEILNSIY